MPLEPFDKTQDLAVCLHYDLAKLPQSRHWANGEVLRYANEPSEFQLTTDETTIYIGHSPATQTYSDIVVKHVDWDPPALGPVVDDPYSSVSLLINLASLGAQGATNSNSPSGG